jgi:hypothetical protein
VISVHVAAFFYRTRGKGENEEEGKKENGRKGKWGNAKMREFGFHFKIGYSFQGSNVIIFGKWKRL